MKTPKGLSLGGANPEPSTANRPQLHQIAPNRGFRRNAPAFACPTTRHSATPSTKERFSKESTSGRVVRRLAPPLEEGLAETVPPGALAIHFSFSWTTDSD